MERRPIGRTGMHAAVIGLGTMTWGSRNTEAEGHAQIDRALAAGVNLLDAAEMYPVPPSAETHGRTEEIIGSWLAADPSRRDRVVIASKVTGPADRFPYLRDGNPRLDRKNIVAAAEASLKRLRTDVIDLYQLHWPDRATNFFGQLGYIHAPDAAETPLAETLGALGDLVTAGKIRAIGLSNDTPWGLMEAIRLSDRLGLPRVATIQNPYSLLNRTFEVGLAEMAMREDCGLLAYSPLGFGTLSGKYLGGARPPGARITEHPFYGRYTKPRGESATARYVAIAREAGLDPAQMALAYVNSRPFVTANLIGATSLDQLESNLASAALTLPADVLEAIEAVHADNPNPAP